MSIEELLKNEDFLKELEAAETDAEVLALFNGKGVAITEEELKAIRSEHDGGELSEEGLEEVAGGYIRPWMPRPISPHNPIVTWIVNKLLKR